MTKAPMPSTQTATAMGNDSATGKADQRPGWVGLLWRTVHFTAGTAEDSGVSGVRHWRWVVSSG